MQIPIGITRLSTTGIRAELPHSVGIPPPRMFENGQKHVQQETAVIDYEKN
jgi:hypothetical protein